MKKIAIVYASRSGQTGKIARYMENKLQERGFSTQLVNAKDKSCLLASNIDAVIYGSPVYGGKFSKAVVSWVIGHHFLLTKIPTAAFSVSLNVADKRNAARAADDELLRKLMHQSGWIPDFAASFAGALKYRAYSWPMRLIMKRISRAAGGDTDTSKDYEYTKWSEVDSFLSAFTAGNMNSRFATFQRFPQYREMDAGMRIFEHFWEGSIVVEANQEAVYRTLTSIPARKMRLANFLGKVRTLGKKDQNLPDESFMVSADRFGNVSLLQDPPREVIAGLIGRFWELNFGIRRVATGKDFVTFAEPDYTKVISNFRIEPVPGTEGSRLHAEMRIHSTSPEAARKFQIYWTFLSPGIRLYMRSALAAIKREAESKLDLASPDNRPEHHDGDDSSLRAAQ